MQLVDEQNDVPGAAYLIHDRFDAFLELAAIFRAGDHQREIESDHPLVTQQLGHVAFGNLLRQAFHDRGLAHARFPEQDRIIFGAAAEDLNHPLDFILAADDRVHFTLARDLRQVASERLERGRFDFALFLGGRLFRAFAQRRVFGGLEVRVEFPQDFLARLLDINIEILEHARRDAVPLAQQTQQNVFGADVGVIQRLGFLGREGQNFFHARRVGDVSDHFLIGTRADLFFDFHPHGFEVEAHFLEHIDGDALSQLDQAEQEVLGADEIVVEPVGFLARQRQHLLRPRREIIHGFVTHSLRGSRCFELPDLSSSLAAAAVRAFLRRSQDRSVQNPCRFRSHSAGTEI